MRKSPKYASELFIDIIDVEMTPDELKTGYYINRGQRMTLREAFMNILPRAKSTFTFPQFLRAIRVLKAQAKPGETVVMVRFTDGSLYLSIINLVAVIEDEDSNFTKH